MMENVLQVRNLIKSFNGVKVVDDISFNVGKGEFFTFLGQNGAGKSTAINMLIGLLKADSGEIVGVDKNKIGVVFQNNIFDDMLSVQENLSLYANLYLDRETAKQKIDEIIKLLGLDEYNNKKFKTLSGGQKRKSEVARALLINPEILFLDEPTTGLDARTRIELWKVITKLRKENGMTIFLTTHYMEEAASADNVVIIHKGKIIANGSPAELKARYSQDKLIITNNGGKTAVEKIADTTSD
jgi:multidrug/hemolysin transport system ATP-binding protein